VRSAILRKEENLARLKTFNGLLYSKFALDIEGNAFGQIGDEDRATIMETFSRYYYDSEQSPPFQIEVLNRRQTANIPSEGNLFALGNFVSFYEDELPLLNARVMTPLAEEAFSRYRFEFGGRSSLAGQTVFIIKVIPTTRVLPAFEGTMKIIKGTYNLVEVDLKPTEATAIAFVRDVHFVQRFDRFEGDVWYPTFLEITGEASVEIVKGLAEIDAKVRATSIVSEAVVNQPLPDSAFGRRTASEDGRERFITAAVGADSAKSEFWEDNALSELTPEEKETYARIDSLVAEADTVERQAERGFGYSISPNLEYSRVASWTPMGRADISLGGMVDVGLMGGYSFGQKRAIGEANVTLTPFASRDASIAVVGGVFSRFAVNHWDRSIPRLVNSVTTAFFHRDYYDWFRQDGWSAGLRGELFGFNASGGFETSRHFSQTNSLRRSFFVREPFRRNPEVRNGNMRVATASIGFGQIENAIVISSGASTDLAFRINGMSGTETGTGSAFKAVEGRLLLEVPTFGTGYVPMSLRLAAQAGIGSDTLPRQYQFRMRTAASIISPFGHFMTAPIGHHGGTEYLALHGEHNFSDIVWRWLGLPTYWGRGIEFIVGGSTGRYRSAIPVIHTTHYHAYVPTGDWYSEVGFGLGKIPTFISNVIFLRLDARFGVGPVASGEWGVAISASSPF
jgi:hypothetical protein